MPSPTRITHWRHRRQNKRRQSGLNRLHSAGIILLVIGLGTGLLILAGFTATALAYAALTDTLPAFADLPHPLPAETETAEFYATDANGVPTLIYKVADPRPVDDAWVTSNAIPQLVGEATVAATEPGFFSNNDTDLTATIALLQGDVSALNLPLAHQLVINNLLDGDVAGLTLLDRLRAALLVQRLNNTYTKNQILEYYLNTAYYGHLAYGFPAAAHAYFNKPMADLTLAETAVLAALPAHQAHNPLDDPAAARIGQMAVLQAMRDAEFINEEALTAAELTIVTAVSSLTNRYDVIAPHFALYVRRELETRLGPAALLHNGLHVMTTLDLSLQRQAECVTQAQINRLSGQIGVGLPADERDSCPALLELPPLNPVDVGVDHRVSQAALIALEPETAVIRAMVGDIGDGDFSTRQPQHNLAVAATHQPGTLLQPFIYLTALSQGYSAATTVYDLPPNFDFAIDPTFILPENGRYQGPLRLRQALGNGLTIPALEVTGWVGIDKMIRTARSLGIRTLDQPASHYQLDISVQGGAVSLLDMVYAYGVMGNMGVMAGTPAVNPARPLDPVAILQIEDSTGEILHRYEPQTREILTPELAYLINDLLADRSARCLSYSCPNVLELPDNRLAAVKSGHTLNGTSAWTIGYTPQLAIGVWMGNDDGRAMDDIRGINGVAPVWHALMSWRMAGEPVRVWPQPDQLVEMAICNISGLLPTPYCPTVSELFIPGTQPTLGDNMYQEWAINRENGRLATLFTPPELIEQQIFRVYPPRATDWAADNGIPQPPTEYDTLPVGALRPDPDAIISHPAPLATISQVITITGIVGGPDVTSYRLAYFRGLTPENLQIITETAVLPNAASPLGLWDTSNRNGLYTLLLTALRSDGSFAEAIVPVTIDNRPPEVEIIRPLPGQTNQPDAGELIIVARANDNIEVDHVAFYVDDAATFFATDDEAPYSVNWQIRGTGCHQFRAVAVDGAGNRGESTAVSVCITANSQN